MAKIQLHKRVDKKIWKTNQTILKSFEKTLFALEEDPFKGDLIPRKNFSEKVNYFYGTDKLFRIPLTNHWRLIYTVIGNKKGVIVLILELFNHKSYNRRFGYKG